MTIPDHLITPLDWSAEALRHAAEWTGQPEGARALVESKRYLAMHEQIERLRAERARALRALNEIDRLLGHDDADDELRGIIDAVLEGDRLPVYAELEQVSRERDELAQRNAELAARLAEIEAQEPSMYVLRSTMNRPAPRAVKHPRYLDVGTGDLVRLGLDHLDPFYARPAPAPAAAPVLEPVHGDLLPPVGSTVWIRHGRDDDAHECTVLGYYAWGDLGGNRRLSRVFVRVAYARRDGVNARMLCDCWPSRDAALAAKPVQAEAEPVRAEPDHCEDVREMVCAVAGLVGRDRVVCDHSRAAGAVCVSSQECAHQRPKHCRCGPDGCSDSTSCPRGER